MKFSQGGTKLHFENSGGLAPQTSPIYGPDKKWIKWLGKCNGPLMHGMLMRRPFAKASIYVYTCFL